MRRQDLRCARYTALLLQKSYLKVRARHTIRVCGANSAVSTANEVSAESANVICHLLSKLNIRSHICYKIIDIFSTELKFTKMQPPIAAAQIRQ